MSDLSHDCASLIYVTEQYGPRSTVEADDSARNAMVTKDISQDLYARQLFPVKWSGRPTD